jgi:tetratricopeptide (TPR) repeat protein
MRKAITTVPILLFGCLAVVPVRSLSFDQAWQDKNQRAIQMQIQGDFEAAEALMHDALKIAEIIGPESREMAISTNNLGSIYLSMHRLDESLNQFLLSSKIWASVFKNTTPNTPLGNLAQVYLELREYRQAGKICQQCMENYDKKWEEKYPKFKPQLLQCLADIAISKRRYPQAVKILGEALILEEETTARDVLDLSTIYNMLGAIEAMAKHWNEAKSLFERSADFAEQSKASCPILKAKVYCNIAAINYRLRDYLTAEKLIKKAHGIIEGYFGGNHPMDEFTLENLAVLYKKMKRKEDAQRCERQAKMIHLANAPRYHSDWIVNAKAWSP